jgi:hypothetical protein
MIQCTTYVWNIQRTNSEVYWIQHYVIKFVIDLWQVGGFLWVLRIPPSSKRDRACTCLIIQENYYRNCQLLRKVNYGIWVLVNTIDCISLYLYVLWFKRNKESSHDPYYKLKHIYRPFVNRHEGLPHQLHWEIV